MAQYNGNVVFKGVIKCASACPANGIPVGLGTGCPYVTHYDMRWELCCFTKYCGVSNFFARYTATKRNAEPAGIGTEIGTLDEGKFTDLIAGEGNPLEDLSVLRHVFLAMTREILVENPRIRKMAQVERALDPFL